MKSIVAVRRCSLQVTGVAAAPYIIVDIVNGDFKAAPFGATSPVAGGLGIPADLMFVGPIGRIISLVAGVLFAL